VTVSFSNGDAPIPLAATGNGIWSGTWTPVAESPGLTVRADAADGQLTGSTSVSAQVLANPGAVVPPTVVDAVLARVGTLSPPAQAALDRLAVIPSGVEVDLLRTLVDDLAPVAEAERAGVVEIRGDVVAFRHELARRAVVESLPASTRLELNADVLRALLSPPMLKPEFRDRLEGILSRNLFCVLCRLPLYHRIKARSEESASLGVAFPD